MRGLAFVGALISLALWAQAASACVCVRAHPAMQLAAAPAALVGVVESAASTGTDRSYVLRVERAIKGELGERVAVHSALTSCQVTLEPGARVGMILSGTPGAWNVVACSLVDPDLLSATADLPAPRGAARFVAAVQSEATDAVALGATGRPAGYGLSDGSPMALARCGSQVVTAARGADGLRVTSRSLPLLASSAGVAVPRLRNVLALGCTGKTIWAAGDGGLVAIRGSEARLVRRMPAAGAVTIAGPRAYFATPGAVRVVSRATNRVRTVRHAGEFATLSVKAGRATGWLMKGGSAVLELRSGRLHTRLDAGPLAWLSRDRLLDATRGRVLDARLRTVRRVQAVRGSVLAVEDGAAYVADGDIVRRLRPGADRATTFARLPGKVVALTSAAAGASAAWHSCEKSAKTP